MNDVYMKEYERWQKSAAVDAALKAELDAIKGTPKEIEERFYTELSFGTAGLRGIIGAGTNRMNVNVVRRATKGVADYLALHENAAERGVAIAYDSRNMSREFAEAAALVLAENGIKAYLYSTLHSVPQLSFTIRELHCIAGIVITASHNPPEYNGYKAYWEHGGQVDPEQAESMLSYIKKADYFAPARLTVEEAKSRGLIVMIGAEIDEKYYAATETLLLHPELAKKRGSELKLVYTPLHGSGNVPVRAMLERIGVKNVFVVAEQEKPDGNFPTVKAPNPEDPGAFTLATKLADTVGASVILATDPDSDRLGVAVRTREGDFRVLTGNQIGSILIHYILSSKKETGSLPDNALVVKSLVSTRLADAICQKFGVQIDHVPTGFRFISGKIAECERTHAHTFVFGFEESYGFLSGSFARDKDAICASMLVAEACIYYGEHGMTLYDVLMDIYETYGYYDEAVKSYTLSGKAGIEKIAAAMEHLRRDTPKCFADVRVLAAEDLKVGVLRDMVTGETKTTEFHGFDVLRYSLEGGAWMCVRPSGTEPKLKLYIGANSDSAGETEALLSKLKAAADTLLTGLLA